MEDVLLIDWLVIIIHT